MRMGAFERELKRIGAQSEESRELVRLIREAREEIDLLRKRCEVLIFQNAELIKERDEYDARRRQAMSEHTRLRDRIIELESKLSVDLIEHC
jgi:hypothetical protein